MRCCSGWRVSRRCDPVGESSNDGCERREGKWIGAILQRLITSGGADVLVGAVADPDLGPVLAVGLGGRQAGLGRGAAFRLLPETDAEANELIDSAKGVAAQLDGFRGSALLDRQALRELILRFALLLRQARDLAVLSPNVIVKVPGTRERMPVLRELTRHGISTNPVDEFNDIPCLQSTAREFSKATGKMVSFAREHATPM
jgi:hypothetical protein